MRVPGHVISDMEYRAAKASHEVAAGPCGEGNPPDEASGLSPLVRACLHPAAGGLCKGGWRRIVRKGNNGAGNTTPLCVKAGLERPRAHAPRVSALKTVKQRK